MNVQILNKVPLTIGGTNYGCILSAEFTTLTNVLVMVAIKHRTGQTVNSNWNLSSDYGNYTVFYKCFSTKQFYEHSDKIDLIRAIQSDLKFYYSINFNDPKRASKELLVIFS